MYKSQQRTRLFSVVATLLMFFSLTTPAFATTGSSHENSAQKSTQSKASPVEKISDRLVSEFDNEEKVTFLVKFDEKADTTKVAEEARVTAKAENLSVHQTELSQRSAVISELKSVSLQSQANVTSFLEEQAEKGHVIDYHSYFIVNGMAVTATQDIAEKLANFSEVEKVLPNEERKLHTTTFSNEEEDNKQTLQDSNEIEWNVERVNAPETWSLGVDGSGTVVASLDTGVQWDHPALQEQYRGYDAETGEVEHEYSFYDATNNENLEPIDDNGHGTHVTGTMVGHEVDGSNQIGVAPGAQWIATKVFDADGNASDNNLLDAAEWILAPGGRMDLAPDIVNNSWGGGPGLDEWYRDTVIAWRDAEIFPAFAAGNTTLFNPGGPGSVAAPANYPESFAVGALDKDDIVADFSLRGPSPYGEIKPDISAPGVAIRSAIPNDSYAVNNGTSMASPAVSGVAALLRQVDANISVDDMEEILLETATSKTDDEYEATPNNGYGHGLIDAFEAVTFISDGLGSIEGSVSKEGEDTEEPTYHHTPVEEVYVDMDSTFKINALDNVSILSVELAYQVNDLEWKTTEASRVSGDHQDGDYEAVIPGEELAEGELTYKWIINDFGDNEVTTEEYTANIDEGITTGYFEDFEEKPAGWTSFGEGDDWEWGVPTSGPEEASSGEHVYATNLDGSYQKDADATLVMPAVNLPEGENHLHFDFWYDLEEIHDAGYVLVSTDQKEWRSVRTIFYDSNGWEEREADLSDYSGQRVYIGFNIDSNTPNEITKPGIYLDNVRLSSSPRASSQEIAGEVPKQAENQKTISDIQEKESLEDEVRPAVLPLDATISVLEGNRSTNTNPADGTYSLSSLASGEYTVEADAYGYYSETKTVQVDSEQTTTTDFVLEQIPERTIQGVVTDEETGEAIEGATLLLVEDANVTPVTTDKNGAYNLKAYEGDYTLRIIAEGYNYEEVDITMDDAETDVNIELAPFHSYKSEEIAYDDGEADFGRSFYDEGNRGAVKMSLAEDEKSAMITEGVFQFMGENQPRPGPGSTEFAVEVWDSTGDNGLPGNKIAGPIEAEAIRGLDEWTVIDLREENIIVDDDFYMVYVQTNVDQYSPALGTDSRSENAERSYEYRDGFWNKASSFEGNFMIRARVGYEIDEAVITAPESGTMTNEEAVTVTGEATPGVEVQLNNHNEAVDTTEVSDDGQFSFSTTLTEGDNEFTVATLLDGTPVGASDAVSVTLDTIAPELTIDNPVDGEKSNRETVTVEGTVFDENLDSVEVNGQKADLDGDQYSKRILLDNGENVIEVVATDEVGNTTTETVTMDVKYDAPEISNLTPNEDMNLETGQSVKIEFDSEPGLRATFVVHMPLTNMGDGTALASNPTELPMMEMPNGKYVGYWTVPANAYANGARIEVKVQDSFGNETREVAEGKLFINLEK